MSFSSILETKVGNESLWKPEFMVLKQGYNSHLAKRIEKSQMSRAGP